MDTPARRAMSSRRVVLRLKVAGPHGSVVKLQIFLQIFQPPFAAVGKRRRNGVPMMKRRSFLALGGVSILAFGATGVRAQTTPAHARASVARRRADGRGLHRQRRPADVFGPAPGPGRRGAVQAGLPADRRPRHRARPGDHRRPAGHGGRDLGAAVGRAPQFIRNHYNEWRVAYAETGGLQRRVDVVFRLYDDGLGFRYEFPDQPALKTVRIGSETHRVQPGRKRRGPVGARPGNGTARNTSTIARQSTRSAAPRRR